MINRNISIGVPVGSYINLSKALVLRQFLNTVQILKEKCEELGSKGVFLSGAGPTMVALAEEINEKFYIEILEFLKTLKETWVVKPLDIDFTGAKVVKK